MLIPSRASNKAFTLLELIVVIVILGLLAALAIPTFARVTKKSQDAATSASVASSLRDARALMGFQDATYSWKASAEAVADELSAPTAAGVLAAGMSATERVTTPVADPTERSQFVYHVVGKSSSTPDGTGLLVALESASGNVCVGVATLTSASTPYCGDPTKASELVNGAGSVSGAVLSGEVSDAKLPTGLAPVALRNAPAAPGAPVLSAGAGELSATWAAVTANPSVTGYVLSFSDGRADVPLGLVTTHTFSATPGTALSVTLKAVNEVGASAASAPSNSLGSSPTAPTGAPTNLALARDGASATLTWGHAPGTRSDYVLYRGVGASQAAATSAVTASSTNYTYFTKDVTTGQVSDLSVAQWYCYSLAARGTSSTSARSNVVCTETKPEAYFLTVDSGGYYTSGDATTWTSRSAVSGVTPTGATYSNGKWYVLGASGKYAYSSDLSSWTTVQTSSTYGLNSLATSADGQTIIAGGQAGRLVVSKDGGATWTTKLAVGGTNTSYAFESVVEFKGRWYATAHRIGSYVSTDGGVTWTPWKTPTGDYVRAVASDGSTMVAINHDSANDGRNYVHTSTNGTTWTKTGAYADSVAVALRVNGKNVATVDGSSGGADAYFFSDTTSARLVTTSIPSLRNAEYLAARGTTVVASGPNGYGGTTVGYSTNGGQTWSPVSLSSNYSPTLGVAAKPLD
jgi:MSHA pilin protein MshA